MHISTFEMYARYAEQRQGILATFAENGAIEFMYPEQNDADLVHEGQLGPELVDWL